MGEHTGIEWTDHTFNPWWGCTKVSPGCRHCYAETLDRRLGGKHWAPSLERRVFGAKHWNEPRRWAAEAAKAQTRRRVFCASMADVLDEAAPASELAKLWPLIRETSGIALDASAPGGLRVGYGLDWLILTKRPERMDVIPEDVQELIWFGVSAENQEYADLRIPYLAQVPARVRFVSAEPLLGPIILHRASIPVAALDANERMPIDWVIVGGESGGDRLIQPMHPDWVRGLRDECRGAGIAFFLKQWGAWRPFLLGDARRSPRLHPWQRWLNLAGGSGFHGDRVVATARIGKRNAGADLDGQEHKELPHARP